MPRLHLYIYIYTRENLKLQGKMSQVQVYDVVKVPSTDYGVAFPYPSIPIAKWFEQSCVSV